MARDWIDGLDRHFSDRAKRESCSEFDVRLRRLREAWADCRTMTNDDFAYWHDRFERLGIADTVGCTFNLYLNDPVLVETMHESALKNRKTLTPQTAAS